MYFNSTTWVPGPFPVFADEDIFAIGDVHGYFDELKALREAISLYFTQRLPSFDWGFPGHHQT